MNNLKRFLFLLLIAGTARAQQIQVPPYLQPGNTSSLSKEQKVLIWQTDDVAGIFTVEYGEGLRLEDVTKIQTSKISFDKLRFTDTSILLYRAELSKLEFDADYVYRVSLNGNPVATASFRTRTKKPQTRFAVFGDCGAGTPEQAAIAFQVYKQDPQFVLITGDNVYPNGLAKEYLEHFFPYYLTAELDSGQGAPLMKSVPFYMMIGNHDIHGANLDQTPDGLAFFYYADLPLNAPLPTPTLTATGTPEQVKDFKKNTGRRFPRIVNYSFDFGNVHIACLDANSYANPTDPALVNWLKADMKATKADWKMVAFHNPGFNSSHAHYNDQLMRLCSPLFEAIGIDMVLSGHVHNYQRSVPFTFSPKLSEDKTRYIISPEGRVDGDFNLDEEFDGLTHTKPKGIIYIVTGAGGAPLYDRALSNKPESWVHNLPQNWVPYTARFISDIHSFTLIETAERKLILRQMDGDGNIIDEITVTK